MMVNFKYPFRNKRPRGKPGTPGPPDTLPPDRISFASSLSGSLGGLTTTATGSLDPDELFAFTARTDPAGTPTTMTLQISSVSVCQVDFPGDYLGDGCTYVSKTGVRYDTTFQSGTVAL